MENQQLHIVRETTTSGQDNSLARDNSSTNDFLNGSDVHNDDNEVCQPDYGATNDKRVFRQDIVMSKHNGMIGIVTEVSGDVDSDSSITDEDEDEDGDEDEDEDEDEGEGEDADENGDTGVDGENKNLNTNSNTSGSITGGDCMTNVSLHADQVRVLWMDETESAQNVNDLIVVDRGFLHGDFVANASDPTGQVGVVVDVNILVDLMAHDGTFIKGVSSKQLKRVRDFTVGDYVVLGPWLGRIDDVLDNVTVMFDDGSMCKVMKADPLHLKPVSKNIIEDANFPYYPGQRVKASSSSLFKNSKWLSGMWKPKRLEGTIIKVAVGSVFVYWIASAVYGVDSSTSPAEEQSPKNLKLLSCFMHANWQLGDWCLFPFASSTNGIDKGLSKLDLHDYMTSESDIMHAGSGCDSEEVVLDALDGNNESMDVDRTSSDKHAEGNRSSESSSCCSSLSVSKEPVHETWPLHRKKIRKVVVKRDKKARKKVENFERALLIVNTRTKVDVAWQDSSIGNAVNSTTLIPVDSPGDHEFVAEQYVIEKASDDDDDVGECRRVGVVRSVNARERTACVRWLKPVARAEDAREFDKEEIVSVYELEAHQDYDYCYGDVVVRLSPVSVSSEAAANGDFDGESELQSSSNEVIQGIEKCSRSKKVKNEFCNEASTDFSDLSWVGNITNLKNGDIEVTWADGMVSTVGPQAIYVVGRDDDDESIAAGSEVSENSVGWETVDDNEMDTLETTESTGQEEIDQNLEIEDNRENGRNSALSVPFAAFRFVTRLASGIFSRGQRSLHPFGFDSKDENEFHFEETIRIDERNTTKEFIPHTSEAINNCCVKSDGEKEVEIIVSKSPELRNEGADSPSPASYLDKIYIFKRFDITKDPLDHYFLGTNGRNDNGRKWSKKVQQDWSILQNNLPDGIYVRVYEDRMDLLRAVIVGAYGTPYQDGLFFFDFNLTPEYPDVPPSAYYNSGGWRINPNLYEEGKVCLSLLNTWTGKGNEVWDPKSSSILQVLVSLQGLVLNSKPYFNEAGYDKQIGTAEGEKNSLSYNENTFLLNCKTMMYVMRKPPKDFEELIKEHFKRRGYFILKACDLYMKGQLISSLTKDATASHKSESDSTSIGFKLMLNKIFPKLFMALDEVGADCEEFRHLLNSS